MVASRGERHAAIRHRKFDGHLVLDRKYRSHDYPERQACLSVMMVRNPDSVKPSGKFTLTVELNVTMPTL